MSVTNVVTLLSFPEEKTTSQFWFCEGCGTENPGELGKNKIWLCESCSEEQEPGKIGEEADAAQQSTSAAFGSWEGWEKPHWEVGKEA